MTSAEILKRYDAEVRVDPPSEAGVTHERLRGIVRTIGTYHCILYAHLDVAEADAAIGEQAAFFRAKGVPFEWKVYGHDQPADLGERLRKAGFAPDESETLVVLDLAKPLPALAVPEAVEIRRVADGLGLEDYLAVSAAAFGEDQSDLRDALAPRMGDAGVGVYVAYANGVPVSAARMDLPSGRAVASLWGGGTIPGWRGRGLYRALVTTRALEARRRGHRFLTVDARETSCPILKRLGFVALTTVTGWRLPSSSPTG